MSSFVPKTVMAVLVTLIALAVEVNPASAQTTATGTGTANSSSNSGAIAVGGAGSASAGASGGSASLVYNVPGTTNSTIRYRSSGSLKTVPNAIAPGLGAAGVETCYGPGVAAGVAGVGFGASFGMGQFDQDCNARLYSRTLYAMGQKTAALQLLINESSMVQRAYGVGRGGAAVAGDGRLVYGDQPLPAGYVRAGSMAPGTRSRGAMFSGCQKWSGGGVGVGHCLY